MYVLDAGPSKWSAFHVIGTVFDRTYVEGTTGHDSQTVSFAPSQGGWVEFTLDAEGNYPFVTHAFGDMVKGAAGILHTTGAPKVAGPEAAAPAPDHAAAGHHHAAN
jgi:nitrite reductase (NO-forming)